MGRKHRNASPREIPSASIRGVRVKFNRAPSLSLDTRGMEPWQHAVGLSAALWCRTRYSVSLSVTDDPYGVWQACRFYVRGSDGIKPDFSDSVIERINSELREGVLQIAYARGFSQQMAEAAVREIGPVPYVPCVFWSLVWQMVGSFSQIRQEMIANLGSVKPVWIVEHRLQRLYRRDLPDRFVLVERGLYVPESCDLPVIYVDASTDPHRFVALASSNRCAGVISVFRNGVVLAWASHDRCYQAVTEKTPLKERLMHPRLQVSISSDGKVNIPPEIASC